MFKKSSHKFATTSKLIANNLGLSLTETIIAAGMLGVIAVAGMKIVKDSKTTTVNQGVKSDLTLITNEINTLLSDPKKCKLTFASSNTPTSIVSRVDDSVTPAVTAGTKFEVDGLYGSENMSIKEFELQDTGTENVLFVEFHNKKILKNLAIGKNKIIRKIGMHVEWDTSTTPPQVSECRSLLSSTTLIWARGAGTDIYYNGGNVGINQETPSELLHVEGKVLANEITATSFMYASDAKLKKNTQTITGAIDKIMALRGVSFDWKLNDRSDYGFIAQEVQKELPELVKNNFNNKTLTVDYAKIIPFLVEGIKQHQKDIELLEDKVIELDNLYNEKIGKK